eukprot:6689802-Prymnesium_polylepis.2
MILAVSEPVAQPDTSTPALAGSTLGTPRGGLQKPSTNPLVPKSSLRSMASVAAVNQAPDVAVGLTSEYDPSMTLFELVPQYPRDGPVNHRHRPPPAISHPLCPPPPRPCAPLSWRRVPWRRPFGMRAATTTR